MVERFLGKQWEVRYYRDMRVVLMLKDGQIVMLRQFERVCDAVDFFASVKTISDARKLVEEV